MFFTTNVDPMRLAPIEDRFLRWISVLGLSLAVLTTLAALAFSISSNIG